MIHTEPPSAAEAWVLASPARRIGEGAAPTLGSSTPPDCPRTFRGDPPPVCVGSCIPIRIPSSISLLHPALWMLRKKEVTTLI